MLLRYFKGYLISSEGKGDFEAMAGIIQADAGRDRVSGTGESMDRLGRFMDLGKVQKMHLALLTGETFSPGGITVSEEPIRAGVKELDELFDFLKGIEEFGIKEEGRDIFGKGIKTGTGRAYLIRREGRIAATAQITAENSCNGMVVGVATDPEWRRNGLARICVTRACRDMIGEGKDVTLFYDNPDAGKLYKDMGFRDRGSWVIRRS